MALSNNKYAFIQLNRTFQELSKKSSDSDDTDFNRAFGFGESLSWDDLINEYRVVILSEAGSGKTAEIRHIAHMLNDQGKYAFFIRLEHIAENFEDAFEVGTYEAFEEWLKSEADGWLLLDSVDEARLRGPADFELAIRKLGRRISTAYDRTHTIITSRITAWRPQSDLIHCTTHLPYTQQNYELEESAEEEDTFTVEIHNKRDTLSFFKIIALNDLNSNQVELFAKARDIKDSKSFLDEIERKDAWSYTTRPQDLVELTDYWLDKGEIGSRLELMRNSIERRINERDQIRAEAQPLSLERVRQGMRLLAAATTLVQDPVIRIPDGANNNTGIAVQSVLPDWNSADQSILLSRPIFDKAIYGTVRFHHRSVREYLTAEWFAELLSKETSRRTIERLFFRYQYDQEIVVPSLRPILPWLVLLDERIRDKVKGLAPEIFFEGGDPSQLPLELRQQILHEICLQMANGTIRRSMHDYSAVQRFANTDLVQDICGLLHQYKNNNDLTAFLLRMVWIGGLSGVNSETMSVALNPNNENYTRITAFRAMKVIGSFEDKEYIRQQFLNESTELERDCLAELVDELHPTKQTVSWLLAAIEKSSEKDQYSVDNLAERVTDFSNVIDLELSIPFIDGLNRLLSSPPVIDPSYCNISQRFQWLLVAASKIVERLIIVRNSESLQNGALSVLSKLSVARNFIHHDLEDIKADFSYLVSSWPELNRTLFWFCVTENRENFNNTKKRLTDFWQVTASGTFCQFEISDFEYILQEIENRTVQDDKLVALSVAFNLYARNGRHRLWREKLKKVTKENTELSDRLNVYLIPPARSAEDKYWDKQRAKWKKQNETYKKRRENQHSDWKQWLSENIDKCIENLKENPGDITNPIHYLFDQTRKGKKGGGRWTDYNWKSLIPEYGDKIAYFYRDSVVSCWRHNSPQIHSEGFPFHQTSLKVILGLAGLEIEANEIEDWEKTLDSDEVKLACRYASFELNGFPTWFPKLYEVNPEVVSEFLLNEIRYELSIEQIEKSTNYILSDVSGSGQWIWNNLSMDIYALLKKEPINLSNLERLLKIVQGSNLSDELIEKLAAKKCHTLKNLEHLSRWFAVWMGINPEAAIEALEKKIATISSSEAQTLLAMNFITYLCGDRRGNGAIERQAFKIPAFLKKLYMLMHRYVRKNEDIQRAGGGVYSPGLRDDAQDARDRLFNMLIQIPGKESYVALSELAMIHPIEESRAWMMLHAKTRAEQDSESGPWQPEQVKDFGVKLERTPCNQKELAELITLRFLDLKDDIENGDSSIAGVLRTITQETQIRNYLGRELREKAFRRYAIPQEEELADAKRPDLRFHGTGFDNPIPVELKLADNWSGPELFERLENQLCGDYLRDNRSSYGFFVLVFRGKKSYWDLPNNSRTDFSGLVVALQNLWFEISPKFSKINNIMVLGIDLNSRSGLSE